MYTPYNHFSLYSSSSELKCSRLSLITNTLKILHTPSVLKTYIISSIYKYYDQASIDNKYTTKQH